MQRLPSVTSWSKGEVTLRISLSCTCRLTLQPTPQYPHTVVTCFWRASSQVPSRLLSYSILSISAPVGQTAMQFPQETQAERGSGTPSSVEIPAENPLPATEIANVFWWSVPQA